MKLKLEIGNLRSENDKLHKANKAMVKEKSELNDKILANKVALKNARDEFSDNIYFKSCSDFCERWDQSCFDPDYNYEPIEFFEPMIREVFKRKAYDPKNIKSKQVFGLPNTK